MEIVEVIELNHHPWFKDCPVRCMIDVVVVWWGEVRWCSEGVRAESRSSFPKWVMWALLGSSSLCGEQCLGQSSLFPPPHLCSLSSLPGSPFIIIIIMFSLYLVPLCITDGRSLFNWFSQKIKEEVINIYPPSSLMSIKIFWYISLRFSHKHSAVEHSDSECDLSDGIILQRD